MMLIPIGVLAGGSSDDKNNSEKTGNYAECWYGDIYYYYNRTTNEFKYGMSGSNGYSYDSPHYKNVIKSVAAYIMHR